MCNLYTVRKSIAEVADHWSIQGISPRQTSCRGSLMRVFVQNDTTPELSANQKPAP